MMYLYLQLKTFIKQAIVFVTTQVVRFKVHSSGVQRGAMNHCPRQDSHEKPAFNG